MDVEGTGTPSGAARPPPACRLGARRGRARALQGRAGGAGGQRGGSPRQPPPRAPGRGRRAAPCGRPGRRRRAGHDGGAHAQGGRAQMRPPGRAPPHRQGARLAAALGRGLLLDVLAPRLPRAGQLLRGQRAAGPARHLQRHRPAAGGRRGALPGAGRQLGALGRGRHGQGRHQGLRAGAAGWRHAPAQRHGPRLPRGGVALGHAGAARGHAALRLRRGLASVPVAPPPDPGALGRRLGPRGCGRGRTGGGRRLFCRPRGRRHHAQGRGGLLAAACQERGQLEEGAGEVVAPARPGLARGRAGAQRLQQEVRRERAPGRRGGRGPEARGARQGPC
mmetsp:Transcript_46236/g.143062  ORF Transcript_46236/g.143062 Transcript_46236/m.143062 type:complete len:335 (+) Transcript_46236:5351-6355(+)